MSAAEQPADPPATYDEAPRLPREPTAIAVPDAMHPPPASDAPDAPVVTAFAAPPRFPSMSDVALAPAPPAAPAPDAAATAAADASRRASVNDSIRAAIEKHAVTPGTGAKKAIEAGERLWTTGDQQELDRLLNEGRHVYVPADIAPADLPSTAAAVYIPVRHADVDPDEDQDLPPPPPPDAAWQHVVTSPDPTDRTVPPSLLAQRASAAAAGAAGGAAAAAAIDAADDDENLPLHPATDASDRAVPGADPATQADPAAQADRALPTDPAAGATDPVVTPSSTLPPPKKADLSRTIFGGSFETVPVISRKGAAAAPADTETSPAESKSANADELAATREVMLRSDSSAHVNVTDDYGLKGGHDSGVNDAAFMEHQTLVTAGNDGKVCIWDMTDRTVRAEFLPYGGEPVTMVYPMPEEDGSPSKNLMTLSSGRLMRIWTVDDSLAFLLRSTQIPHSERDLYMSVPVISKELKERAAAAAAAAAVTTTDAPQLPTQLGSEPAAAASAGKSAGEAASPTTVTSTPGTTETTPVGAAELPVQQVEQAAEAAAAETKEDEKKFSFTRVLGSFRRSSSSKKAVAS